MPRPGLGPSIVGEAEALGGKRCKGLCVLHCRLCVIVSYAVCVMAGSVELYHGLSLSVCPVLRCVIVMCCIVSLCHILFYGIVPLNALCHCVLYCSVSLRCVLLCVVV